MCQLWQSLLLLKSQHQWRDFWGFDQEIANMNQASVTALALNDFCEKWSGQVFKTNFISWILFSWVGMDHWILDGGMMVLHYPFTNC